jgi:hypothetical protein
MVSSLLLVATLLATPDAGSPATHSHSADHAAGVDHRGDQGMGFSPPDHRPPLHADR